MAHSNVWAIAYGSHVEGLPIPQNINVTLQLTSEALFFTTDTNQRFDIPMPQITGLTQSTGTNVQQFLMHTGTGPLGMPRFGDPMTSHRIMSSQYYLLITYQAEATKTIVLNSTNHHAGKNLEKMFARFKPNSARLVQQSVPLVQGGYSPQRNAQIQAPPQNYQPPRSGSLSASAIVFLSLGGAALAFWTFFGFIGVVASSRGYGFLNWVAVVLVAPLPYLIYFLIARRILKKRKNIYYQPAQPQVSPLQTEKSTVLPPAPPLPQYNVGFIETRIVPSPVPSEILTDMRHSYYSTNTKH